MVILEVLYNARKYRSNDAVLCCGLMVNKRLKYVLVDDKINKLNDRLGLKSVTFFYRYQPSR